MPFLNVAQQNITSGIGRFLKDLGPNMFYENAFDYGIDPVFLKGQLRNYKPQNILKFLAFSGVVGSASYLAGDLVDNLSDKYYKSKNTKFDSVRQYIKNPSLFVKKHPVALTLALGALAVGYLSDKQKDKKGK